MNMYQKREERKNKPDPEKTTTTNINWFPGHMAKTKREIREKIDLIDIIYEVIDSRMPISSKIADIDDLIKDKPRIIIMTKYDMCDKKETDKFVKYYEKLGYQIIRADLMNDKTITSKIIEMSKKELVLLNEKRMRKGLKPRCIRALIVGVPNVGKSTLINRLVGKKAVNVGNQPGVTKNLSWIRINKDVELMDSPGILWPKIENQEQAHILASLSSIKEEILDLEDLSGFILKKLYKLYPEKLEERYKVKTIDEDDMTDTFKAIGSRRGALIKGGKVDFDKVYSIVIKDIKDGNFSNITFDRLNVKDNSNGQS